MMIEHLPELDSGLSPRQQQLLLALVDHTSRRRRQTIECNRLLELVVGSPTPSLEAKLTAHHLDDQDPHLSSYLTLVELSQGFRTRYPLVEGIGNMGTIDGDLPADSMFNRCAASPFAVSAVRGVVPTLLVNGAALTNGMLLPHRLGDVLTAAERLLEEPTCSDQDLVASIPGPDFPTGGTLVSSGPLQGIYATGYGELRLRAHAQIVPGDAQPLIEIQELPYGVWKRELVQELHDRFGGGAQTAIDDISDRSDANQIRIVIAVSPVAQPERVLEELFDGTRLETRVAVAMAASVDGHREPVTMPVLLRAYLRQLSASLVRRGIEPTVVHLRAELDGLRLAHDDARRTRIA